MDDILILAIVPLLAVIALIDAGTNYSVWVSDRYRLGNRLWVHMAILLAALCACLIWIHNIFPFGSSHHAIDIDLRMFLALLHDVQCLDTALILLSLPSWVYLSIKYRRNVMLSCPAVLLGNMGTIFWLTRHIKIAQLTEPKRRKLVAVVMSHRRLPALVPFDESKARAPSFGGERFREKKCRDWLGYYNWLRNDSGEYIGLRLHLDDPADIDLTHLKTVTGVDLDLPAVGTRRDITIFFGDQQCFREPISGHKGFTGNRLFIGNKGSVALTFHPPNDAWWSETLKRIGVASQSRGLHVVRWAQTWMEAARPGYERIR